MACGLDLLLPRIRHNLRLHERDEAGIVVQNTVPLRAFKPGEPDQKILFHLVANRFGKNEPINPGRAQREDRFVQSPGRDNAGSQHV